MFSLLPFHTLNPGDSRHFKLLLVDLKGFAPKYFLTLQKLPVCSRLILKRVHLLCGHSCPSLAVAASSVAPNGARLLPPSPANSPEQTGVCGWGGGAWGSVPGPLTPWQGVEAQREAEERGIYFYIPSPQELGCTPEASLSMAVIPGEYHVFGKLDPCWACSEALSPQGGSEPGTSCLWG